MKIYIWATYFLHVLCIGYVAAMESEKYTDKEQESALILIQLSQPQLQKDDNKSDKELPHKKVSPRYTIPVFDEIIEKHKLTKMSSPPHIDLYEKRIVHPIQILLPIDSMNEKFAFDIFIGQNNNGIGRIQCLLCKKFFETKKQDVPENIVNILKRSITNHLLSIHYRKKYIDAACEKYPDKKQDIQNMFQEDVGSPRKQNAKKIKTKTTKCLFCETSSRSVYLSQIVEHLACHIRFVKPGQN